MEAYEKAEQILKKTGDKDLLAVHYEQAGHAALEWGHYEKALQYALKYGELTGDEHTFLLGDLYKIMGDYETALEYHRKAPVEGHKWQYKYLALGSTFYLRNQYDSALYYYQLFLDFSRKSGEGELGKAYANLGELYFTLRHYDTAFSYLNRALNMHKGATDLNQVMRVLLVLSKTYKEKREYPQSMQTSRELLQIANETGARQYSRDAHFLLYELFEQVQNQDSAYRHLQQYTVLKDSVDLDLSAQKLAFYKRKSEREQAQSKINTLNDEKKLQQQKLEQTSLQKNFLTAGSIALLLIAVVVFRNFSLKRKNEKLRLENELKLQQLVSEKTKAEFLQQASELEMQALRAQMNPHFIFNSLNSINSFILENERLQASEYLSKFSRLVRLILQNSRETLIPLERELEALGLYLELESLRFEEKFEYKIWVNDDVDTAGIKVPPLIIQPYAENAIWHGLMHKKGRGRLLIELYHENAALFCKITDNGIGRKIAEELKNKSSLTYKSMGMKITADRIGMLHQQKQNDNLITVNDLVTPDGQSAGTEVVIKMPLQYD